MYTTYLETSCMNWSDEMSPAPKAVKSANSLPKTKALTGTATPLASEKSRPARRKGRCWRAVKLKSAFQAGGLMLDE